MSSIESILELDRELLFYLNNLGNETWDSFWLNVTNKYVWIPLYVAILLLFINHLGWKKTLFTLLIIAVMLAFVDQFVNLIKESVHRVRPNRDEDIKALIRVVKNSRGFSFVSGHATNSMAISIFVIQYFKNDIKWIYLVLLWPFLFAYSRIYLGVHYPTDILGGMALGVVLGIVFYKINQRLITKI